MSDQSTAGDIFRQEDKTIEEYIATIASSAYLLVALDAMLHNRRGG